MNIDEKIEKILDGLRKIAFYVGHGKYNEHMSTNEVNELKAKFEKILQIENNLEKLNSNEKELIYKELEKYTNYTVKDFIELKMEDIS